MPTSEMYKYFKENDIEYNDIDPEMRELIYLINAKLNIKTKYCCIGEEDQLETYIMFDDSVTDEQIVDFYKHMINFQKHERKMCEIFYQYKIEKWIRILNKEIKMNWIFKINKNKDLKFKIKCIKSLCKDLKDKRLKND